MAKRRKKRGLAGSPMEHEEAIKDAAYASWDAFKDAERFASAGNCSRALTEYADAWEYQGRMRANEKWAPHSYVFSDTNRVKLGHAEDAARAAMKRCLVGKK